MSSFPSVILKYNIDGSTFHASTSNVPPEVPPGVPTDMPPLATHVSPVPEEVPCPSSNAVPIAAQIPAPVSAQPTPTAEQPTPAQASTSKKHYNRMAGRILQSSPSTIAAVDSGSESPSPQ
ncbi:lysine-rich arabinogalactan protein 19-like [Hibiscus syriacus]|uniref:lysine-rich arabinogalactan protein 19-like n=1 Tax=Hibiscus syriacus TaxID=106335 RepID=UPI0019237451|nr:lysine-rich arabinogalactan protein 19-like [Hibiscus syriacus]